MGAQFGLLRTILRTKIFISEVNQVHRLSRSAFFSILRGCGPVAVSRSKDGEQALRDASLLADVPTSQVCNGHSNEELPWPRKGGARRKVVPACSHQQFLWLLYVAAQTYQRTRVGPRVHKKTVTSHVHHLHCEALQRNAEPPV